jgi:hypothetical protein
MANALHSTSPDTLKETREAYANACARLGYDGPTPEAADVIDILGEADGGSRWARLAAFYPASMTADIDRAARLARKYPEALLSDSEQRLLDLLLGKGRS